MAVAGIVSFYLPQRAQSSPWSESTSPHFSLYAEGHSRQDHDILRLLERSRNLFLSLGMLNPAREHPITVFEFKDGESFSRYAPPHSAGFFQRGQAADYICLLDQRSDIILHEYAHAAIATLWPSLPVWLNEGLAGYYSTAKWGRDSVGVGGFLWSDQEDVFNSLSARMLPSVLDLPNTLIDDDARSSSQRYMLSWALVQMMITQPRYANKFRRFLDALSIGTSVRNALQSSYALTLAELEDDFGKHLQKKRFATVKYPFNADLGEEGGADSETNEFDIELKLADLLSFNPSAISMARVRLEQLSVQYPESPQVEEGLAALSWRIGDEAGVRAHMKKAYQHGSRNAELLTVDAELELKIGAPHSQIIRLLERGLAEEPSNYNARMALGYLAYQSKEYARALSLLKPIEDVDDPNAFVVLGSLAYSAAGAEDYSSASTYTFLALKKARSDSERTAMTKLLNWIAPKMASSTSSTEPGGTTWFARLTTRQKSSASP
jgi:tetratricopeptide (TPR) repeat protein